jgi:hypothetical protein
MPHLPPRKCCGSSLEGLMEGRGRKKVSQGILKEGHIFVIDD